MSIASIHYLSMNDRSGSVSGDFTPFVGFETTYHFYSLLPGEDYTVVWGDGTADTLASSDLDTADFVAVHNYETSGTYEMQLIQDSAQAIVLTVSVEVQNLTGLVTIETTGTVLLPGGPENGDDGVLGYQSGRDIFFTFSDLAPETDFTVNWGDGSPDTDAVSDGAGGFPLSHTYHGVSQYTVTVSDLDGKVVSAKLVNVIHRVGAITAPDPAAVGTEETYSFWDWSPEMSYVISWGDDSADTPVISDEFGEFTATHTYFAADLYVLTVKVGSIGITTETVTAAAVPGTVVDLTATAGDTEVILTWTAPAFDGGSPITDYVVQYMADGDTDWVTFTDAVSSTTGATVTGLSNGVYCDFQVAAVNVIGTGDFAAISATPTAA